MAAHAGRRHLVPGLADQGRAARPGFCPVGATSRRAGQRCHLLVCARPALPAAGPRGSGSANPRPPLGSAVCGGPGEHAPRRWLNPKHRGAFRSALPDLTPR